MNKADRQAVTAKTEELIAFIAWLPTVERAELERWLADAFWKDEMPNSELVRFFKLALKGVDMRDVKEDIRASRRKRKGVRPHTHRAASTPTPPSRLARARQ